MKREIFARFAAAAVACTLLTLPTVSIAAGQRGAPSRVADLREIDLRLDGRHAALTAAKVQQPMQIRSDNAAFIKVHFAHFNLPRGVTLEVSNPQGTEVYRYSKTRRDGFTVSGELKQNGRTSFSAMSISGPTAVLRLVGVAQEPWTTAHGVRVSQYLEGFPTALLPQLQNEKLLDSSNAQPMAICGTNDKKAVACYAGSEAAAVDRSRPVAIMYTSSGGACTAWRVGSSNHMFTNNHCAATASDITGSEFWFNHQLSSCTGTAVPPVTKVTGASMLSTNASLDYTLFTVNSFSSIASFGYFGLETRAPVLNEQIYISGHPGGRKKELAIVSDQDGGGNCKVNDELTSGNGNNTDMGYYCDTEGGNSGSPVMLRSNNKVIALHHLGGCLNQGVQIAKIWPVVASFFNNVVPVGDNGGGGNVNPVANFSSSTSGLTATFTDSSADSDGSIASRSWNFGDSTTSTLTNPGKTYSAAGTYNVSLTVTDNGGLTNTVTKAVTVATAGSGNVLINGIAKTGISAATGTSVVYTMMIPTDTPISNLKFVMSGGTGDADMYVKYGSAPTDTVYDCRPYAGGNAETCNIATAQAGTYYIRLKSYAAFSGVSLTGSYTTDSRLTYSNTADYTIGDNTTVDSPITVSGRAGNGSTTTSVTVAIVHTYQGDLKVDLVAPDGSLYNIHNRTGAGTDNINKTVTLNTSTEALNGIWKLRVNDNAAGDVGRIDSWSIKF